MSTCVESTDCLRLIAVLEISYNIIGLYTRTYIYHMEKSQLFEWPAPRRDVTSRHIPDTGRRHILYSCKTPPAVHILIDLDILFVSCHRLDVILM